ncbi:Ger(x)C family spore germination protein [Paenibacillus psychroresistens]|uniref:Ger(X)C family spore germination protein n=1 Tax=Paenibacillus psychroresistens TaxID=1778678 RepID=A0A6B8RLW6_9BACL|nr:Ger(x)C family spore germination protein [Paenibacillus psychroresistens]QGQ97310.1 Ger(x)C family spore germination protein [Paenibacillus psychroresistens]
MKLFLYIGLLFTVLITSGCWDRVEINDLAFVMGTALDLSEDGNVIVSVQIAIPSSGPGGPGGGGGRQEKFFVISAVGKNGNEAHQLLQKKSSRTLFTAHRGVVFIGERLAKHGIKDAVDVFTHDPRNRLKTYIMVVKGREGREILQTKYPFEQVPIEAVKEMEGLGTDLAVTLRDFFMAASSEGISPVMGVMDFEDSKEEMKENKNKIFKLGGSAIFKNFKLVGFLNEKETNGFIWVTDKLKHSRINAYLPEGNGNVGMVLYHVKRKITPEISGDKVKILIQLWGQGSLVENNSQLDISLSKNLDIVQKALEKSVKEQIQTLLAKVQKQYKVDSMGFGQEIYRNMPKKWELLKGEWDNKFPEVDTSIEVKLTISGIGMAGPPLQLKDKEIIK